MDKLVGGIDGYSDGGLVGWAWDADEPSRRLKLGVYVDGVLSRTITADTYRDDLAKCGIGDGRYAFQLPLWEVAGPEAKSVDLRYDGTETSLARSPANLDDTFRPHRERLRGLLDSAPFWVSDFNFDGTSLSVQGFYHPRHRDVSAVSLDLDGIPAAEIAWHAGDPSLTKAFWFLDPAQSGFTARFDLGAMPQTGRDSLRLSLRDPITPVDPLRAYQIPLSLDAYRNLPSAERQLRVMGWADNARFVMLGRTHYETIVALATRYGMPASRIRKLLDWGVGCGRIARHFLAQNPTVELHGVDIDANNVGWCSEHLPAGHFIAGPLVPPLPYPDASFDIIHANSVFTHLTEDIQDAWLDELTRLLTPDGVVIATVHAETASAYARMPVTWLQQLEASGIDAVGLNKDLHGHVADEEYYRNTYHSVAYISEHWARHVEILGFHRHLFGYQDVVVFRKPTRRPQGGLDPVRLSA